jgi:hypothetical protein
MGRWGAATHARIDRLESNQEGEAARLARLQEDMSALRREFGEQLAAARQDASREIDGLEQRLAASNDQAGRDRHQLRALSRQLDRQRIDFEAPKNQRHELVSGLSLTITRTNPQFRRFDGYLWLLADRRAVWVKNQSVQRPVTFYSKQDGRPYDLVVTHVTNRTVAGYLLAPRTTQPDVTAATTDLSRTKPAGSE